MSKSIDYLDHVVGPGSWKPAHEPARRRVSLTQAGRDRNSEGVHVACELANRVSDVVREQVTELVALGAITVDEGNRIAWRVEDAAGADTHCLPGSATLPAGDASDDADTARIIDSRLVGTGECGAMPPTRPSRTACCLRGVMTSLATWVDHEMQWEHVRGCTTPTRSYGIDSLSDEDRQRLKFIAAEILKLA